MKADSVNVFLALLVALLLAANASAMDVTVSSSADSVYISSTTASVVVYAVNPFNGTADARFSASSQYLDARFQPYSSTVRKGARAGATLQVSAPDCFRGIAYVEVTAQVCSATNCQTASKEIRVFVTPARACSSYIDGYAEGDNYVPEVSCSPSGCTTSHPRPQSQIVKTASFEPIGYDVRLSGGDSCISFLRGEVGSAELTLRNRGAAGSFNVRVVGPDTQLMAYSSRDYVSLARGGSESLKAYFRAEPEAEEGRHFATIQFIHGADVVAEKDLCVEIKDRHEVKVSAPRSAQVNPERETSLQFEVENLGTSREGFTVSLLGVPGGVEISPQGFDLEPGETKVVDVIFSPGALKAQKSTLEFRLDSDYSHARASVEITRTEQVPYPGIFAGNTTESGGAYTFEVIVKNGQSFDIDNVSFEVQGLPSGWESTVPSAIDIPAGKQARVPVVIRPGSDAEAASLVLVVKHNGREIGRQTLPVVKGTASGLSGFLTLGTTSGAWLIILILLLAVIVILMSARIRKDVRSAQSEHLSVLMREVESGEGAVHEDHAFHASFAESLHSINREAGK